MNALKIVQLCIEREAWGDLKVKSSAIWQFNKLELALMTVERTLNATEMIILPSGMKFNSADTHTLGFIDSILH